MNIDCIIDHYIEIERENKALLKRMKNIMRGSNSYTALGMERSSTSNFIN